MNLAQFQSWLNTKGAKLAVDGKAGPATRAAIIETFRNKAAPACTDEEKAAIARSLGGSLKQLQAVDKVESGGAGWGNSGLLKALYERHYFWRRVRILIPVISNPSPGGYTIDADRDGINDSWEKLADAAMRNPIAAFESVSFGRFQIMGAHAAALGYGNAIEFAWALSRDEAAHYRALAAFIRTNGLQKAFTALSADPEACRAFAKGYNGGAYAKMGYHIKLAKAMA